MRVRRNNKFLVEPPTSATGDIAFNLIVFFLVCASVQPDSGRKQTLPSSEQVEEEQQVENIEVALTREVTIINGEVTRPNDVLSKLTKLIASKTNPDEKVVIVKSSKDTPYFRWISTTSLIEDAGGIVTLQLEEEREVQVP